MVHLKKKKEKKEEEKKREEEREGEERKRGRKNEEMKLFIFLKFIYKEKSIYYLLDHLERGYMYKMDINDHNLHRDSYKLCKFLYDKYIYKFDIYINLYIYLLDHLERGYMYKMDINDHNLRRDSGKLCKFVGFLGHVFVFLLIFL